MKSKTLFGSARKAGRKLFLAGLGVAAVVEEQAKRSLNALAEKGEEVSERRANRKDPGVIDRFQEAGGQLKNGVRDRMARTVHWMGAPSREEVQKLTRSVERLTDRIKTMEPAK